MIVQSAFQANQLNAVPTTSFSLNRVRNEKEDESRASLLREKHNQSQFIVKETALKWPSISEFRRASTNKDWTISSLKTRINELKADHRSQLNKCTKYLGRKEYTSLDELHIICEEFELWEPPNVVPIIKRMHAAETRLLELKTKEFIIYLRRMQYETLVPLYRKLRELQIVEDRAKQQRAKLFPKSTRAWRDMDTKDAKLAVARFLMLDKRQQEEHLNKNKTWKDSKADVDNLCSEYENNVVFEQEVKTFLKENETTDPRKKGQ